MLCNETTSTRDLILLGLKRHGERSVGEMAKELEITEMAVRRHIQALEKDGFVQTKLVRQAMGRPTTKYLLTEKGEERFPRNYLPLTLGFLKDIEELSGIDMVHVLFEKRKERLLAEYANQMKGCSFSERVEVLAQIQNDNGYMVEWKKIDDDTYQFIEYNCPISQVAKAYPVACACEKKLFKELLQTEAVVDNCCAAKDEAGYCSYTLKKPSVDG
ncbi:transcriptional regulator [Halalkalibacterium halodurans]|uniref:helix-turn-helix transcriptional regulator n=1 Tax=Halalkalibacterium halodurans TaxID=86665 RepID=UPI002E1F2CAC|nr:transcriptional regulator [Halalkalibacterium halodurans]